MIKAVKFVLKAILRLAYYASQDSILHSTAVFVCPVTLLLTAKVVQTITHVAYASLTFTSLTAPVCRVHLPASHASLRISLSAFPVPQVICYRMAPAIRVSVRSTVFPATRALTAFSASKVS